MTTAPKTKSKPSNYGGAVRVRKGSLDLGSYSAKVVSDEKSGSFLTMAAEVGNDALDDFSTGLVQGGEGQSYDLTIFDDEGAWPRWIIGSKAEGRTGMQRVARSMDRAADPLYHVWACAFLRTAFPESNAQEHYHELRAKQWTPDDRWCKPVAVVASIAPSYFKNWPTIVSKLKNKCFHFYDNQTETYYAFKVVAVRVVPESFGGYAKRLYALDERGQIIIKDGLPLAKRGGGTLQSHRTVALDAGGRTFDVMVWNGKEILKARSFDDLGLHSYIEEMVEDIVATYPDKFGEKPTRYEVYTALTSAMKHGQSMVVPTEVKLIGKRGKSVDVTPVILRRMNMFVSKFFEVYDEFMRGGQGIYAIVWMGGVSRIIEPFIKAALPAGEKQLHEREEWVGRKYEDIYMANAQGAYAWGALVFQKVQIDE